MTPKQFTTALGLTESNGNLSAPLGDSGQAMGRWQVHPCWVWDHCKLIPKLRETWDAWIERNIEAFFVAHDFLPAVEVAMFFHLGHRSLITDLDWDGPYAARFVTYAKTV